MSGSQIVVEDSTPDESYGSEPLSDLDIGTIRCWAFSYLYETFTQFIDFLDEGFTEEILDDIQPPITVSVWTAARWDCASKYTLKVCLLGDDAGNAISEFEETREAPVVGRTNEWVQKSTHFRNMEKESED